MRKVLFICLFISVSLVSKATLFYSQGTGGFTDSANWNSVAGGGGVTPVAYPGDFTNGNHIFLIQNGHTVTIDNDIIVDGLIVGEGVATTLGIDGTSRTIEVKSSIYIETNGRFNPTAGTVTHNITLSGNSATLTNRGTFDLFTNNNRNANFFATGNGNISLSATTSTEFYNLTVNGGGTINTSGTNIFIQGIFTVTNTSSIIGSANMLVYDDATVDVGSEIDMSNGTFRIIKSGDQTITCSGDCEFYNLRLERGTGGLDGIKTFIGGINVVNQMRIDADATFMGGDNVTINNQLFMLDADGWDASSTLRFERPNLGCSINTNGFSATLGTSDVIINGRLSISNNNSGVLLNGDLSVLDNQRLVISENARIDHVAPAANDFILGSGALLFVRGFDNFPINFNTFSFDKTSRTLYDGTVFFQTIKGDVDYGDLVLSNNFKNVGGIVSVAGNLTVNNGCFLSLVNPGEELHIKGNVNGSGGSIDALANTTVFLDGIDQNQTLDPDVTYQFHDFIISNVGPITGIRTKDINNDLQINGNMTITNTDGNAANSMIVDIDAFNINAVGAGTFTINDNVELRTSGLTSFDDMFDAVVPSFSTSVLSNNSAIRFDGTGDQELPGLTYGNIILDNGNNKNLNGNMTINGSMNGDRDVFMFNDNGFEITLFGNWDFGNFGTGFNRTNLTGKFIFAGADQVSNESNFNEVVFAGTGTKTMNHPIDAACDFTVEDGVTFTSDYDVYVGCDLLVNGTGKLLHNDEEFFLDGTVDQNITISDPSTSFLESVNIRNNGNTIILNTDLDVNGFLSMNDNSTDVTLSMVNRTLKIGGDFTMSSQDVLDMTGGTIEFDGVADQIIANGNPATIYNNLSFLTGGEKRFSLNTADIDGNVLGDASVTINQNGIRLNVSGDWTHLGSIGGGTGNDIYFDGGNQSITGSEFNDVYFDGTDVKTLGVNTSIKGSLYINIGSTLDVGTDNSITLNGNWNNDLGGSFLSNNGRVSFSSNSANIYTGGTGVGKDFYDLEINLAQNTSNVNIQDRNPDLVDAGVTLGVNGSLTILKGRLSTGARSIILGQNLIVASTGIYNGNNFAHNLFFRGSTGVYDWTPGPSDIYRTIIFEQPNATWNLNNTARIQNGERVEIRDGKFDLNGNDLTFLGANSDIVLASSTAEFEIDAGATLTMGTNTGCDIINTGGTLTIVGTASDPATVNSSSTFDITMTGATAKIAANHYSIAGLRDNGIDIQNGKVDPVNNFSNGSFTGGVGTSYLKLYNGAFDADAIIQGVSFSDGSTNRPTFNVDHPAGMVLTFEDANGNASGPARENDDNVATTGNVQWTYTSGFFWVGLDATDATNWNRAANWSTGTVPNSNSDVILDHTTVGGVYDVNVNTTFDVATALAKSITIINSGGAGNGKITLSLNGKSVDVSGQVSIGTGNEIEQNLATDTLFIEGSYSIANGGILNGPNSAIVFDADSGNFSISTNSNNNANRDFNDVFFRGGANYTLSNILEISGDLEITGSDLNIGDASNRLDILGNVTVSDSGSFTHSNAQVRIEGTGGTQLLNFGGQPVYDLTFGGTSKKTISGNLSIEDDIVFENTTDSVNAGDNFIFVSGDWRNDLGPAAFKQSGGGTVVFNGSVGQTIGQTDFSEFATDFMNIIFQSSGAKTIYEDISIDGDIQILLSTDGAQVIVRPGVVIIGRGVNDQILMQNGTLRIEGTDGFPTDFEDIDLLGGTVDYRTASLTQNIVSASYFNLRLRNSGSVNEKNVLGDIEVRNSFFMDSDVLTQLNMNCFELSVERTMSIRTGALPIDWGTSCITTCGTGGTLVLGESITTIDADLTSFHNITVENNGVSELRLLSNLTLGGNLKITEGSRFDMRQFTATSTCADPSQVTFTLGDNSELETQVASGSNALPDNFGNYAISTLSLVEYQRAGNQDVFTNSGTIIYGDLELENSGTKTLEGDLRVVGDFLMTGTTVLIDNANDMTFSGDLNTFNNYTATPGTVTSFNGTDQTIRVDNGTTATFAETRFSGNGTKLFWEGEVYNFMEDFKVGASSIIDFRTYNQDITFTGDSVIVEGTILEDGGDNDFRFNKNGIQIVDLGPNSDIAHLEIKTNADVFIIGNGLNVTGNGGTQNFVEVENNASLDLGDLSHVFGQDFFTITGSLNAVNANLTFNQTGVQVIDAFAANNVVFTGTSDKDMNGIWRMNDVEILGGARVDFNGQDTMVVRGNWKSESGLDKEDGVVRFEINDADPRTIQTNNVEFSQVKFVQIGTNAATYTMVDNLYVDDTLRLGTGTTLDINGNILIMGFSADGGTADELLTIETGAKLEIDEGSSMLFDCSQTNDANVDVFGTLSIIGTPAQVASVARNSGAREIDIDVIGGTLEARYYTISNLSFDGLFLDNNSTLDPVNNFSDGTFTNMQEGSGSVYMHIESDLTGVNDIKNISFSHSNPVVGVDYNVRRTRLDGGILTFDNEVSGGLAGFEYEDEVALAAITGRIVWPLNVLTNWTAASSGDKTNWFDAGNWDNGIPDSTKTAVIGTRPFMPIITAGFADTAFCKKLILDDNAVSLTLRDGIDLFVNGDVELGSGGDATSLLVEDPNSNIIVAGNWFKTNNSLFVNGGAKVIFKGTSSTITIDHDDIDGAEAFNDIEFDNPGSFQIIGNLNVDGDVLVTQGTISPNTTTYSYLIGGDWDATGGSFSTTRNGTVTFDGLDQNITNANFDNLIIENSGGCDHVIGTLKVDDLFTLNGCLIADAGSAIDWNDDVSIAATGSFDDGGETHTFSGINWTGLGTATLNTGTVEFDRVGGIQNIFQANFNSMLFTGTSRIELEGKVDVTGDVTFNNSINEFHTKTFEMDNITGTGTFTFGDNETIRVSGANNFPAGFSTYVMGPSSNTYYDRTADQIVLGGFDYGDIFFQNTAVKTIDGGDVGVQGNLTILTATLDASINNYNISVGGNWTNGSTGSFEARMGTVTFDGAGNQALNPGFHILDGDKSFYNVTVNNTGTTSQNVDVNVSDILIENNLNVTDGTFTLVGVAGGFDANVGGNLTASGTGIFARAGKYILDDTGNRALQLSTNGSPLLDIEISASANTTYTMQGDVTVDGNFVFNSGKVNTNGFITTLGTDINDAVTIAGDLSLTAGSELLLGNQTSLAVSTTGSISVVGNSSNPAVVSNRYSFGDYNFVVNGDIDAQFYIFDGMSSQGIVINSTATIDNTNNFSNGIFSNPTTSGLCLRIENNQKFTEFAGNRIENVSFPTNPGSGTVNVAKTVALGDSVEFYNATGPLSGENFDNDPNDKIFWTGPRKMIWTGAKNTNWFDVLNWMATAGPTQVPDSTLDAQIPFVTNLPSIDSSGAFTQLLTIEQGAIVFINTPNDTSSDLTVYGELSLEGAIRTNTVNDVLEVKGNWSRINSGNYSYGTGGLVLLTNSDGAITLNNGTSPFYDLKINTDGNSVLISTDIVVDNDLTIENGILDVTTASNQITISGDFVNTGTFNARNGTVEFDTPGTSNLDGANTDFYNLTMSGTGVLNLTNDLQVDNITQIEDGLLKVNLNKLNIGDGSGTDLLRVNGGTVDVETGASIDIADNGGITVSSGGLLKLLGTSLSNRAVIQNQGGNTKFSFSVSSGGTLEARFYTVDGLNQDGITFQSGSSLDSDNNLSYGTLTNGTSGGTLLTFNNTESFTDSDQIEFVEFPTNPGGGASNVKKLNAVGNVDFYWAFGDFHGEDFDNDPNERVTWDADVIWTGATSTPANLEDWFDSENWNPVLEEYVPLAPGDFPRLIPTIFTDVIIPVVLAPREYPILVADGLSEDLWIQEGASLTIENNANLEVNDSVLVYGLIDIDNTSNTEISLGGSWEADSAGVGLVVGTFNSGNSSTLVFTSTSGVESINTNNSVCGIRINSESPSTSIIETNGLLDINCDFVIDRGFFRIKDPAHVINLAGNWDNNSAITNTGFIPQIGSVVFDGSSIQSISHAGGEELFYDVTVANSGGNAVLNNNISLLNDLTINDGSTLEVNSNKITLDGNWNNLTATGSGGFIEGNGTVEFDGSSVQKINHVGGVETFNNLIINNSLAAEAIELEDTVNVANELTLTDGIVGGRSKPLVVTNTDASAITAFSSSSFVFGELRRYIAENTGRYSFPVGLSTALDGYFPVDILNDNLKTTSFLTASVEAISEVGDNIDSKMILQQGGTGSLYTAAYGEIAEWTVTPDVQPTGGTYGMEVLIDNFAGLIDNQFALIKRPETSTSYEDWTEEHPNTVIPADGTPGRTVVDGTAIRTGFQSFSLFTVGGSDQVLPIQLVSFQAELKNGAVDLHWVTAQEINNDFFTVEKSSDGVNWEAHGHVSGAGNSLEPLVYHLRDTDPYSPITYYRLKQTDFDGSETYSNIVALDINRFSDVSIFPNPTEEDYVHIDLPNRELVENVRVMDILGVTLLNVYPKFKGDSLLEINFGEKLNTGHYIIKIEYTDGTSHVMMFSSY